MTSVDGGCGACTLYNDVEVVVFIDVNGRCQRDRGLKEPDNSFK